jgi:predicted transcriptional regulator of viral defense system
MQRKLPQLGPTETQLFAWIQLQDRNVVKAGEFARILNLTAKQESNLYSRLCRSKLAIRLMKGIYLLPSKIPPGGNWGPNPYWIIDKLMNAIAAKYQITGRAAFNRYGFSEQVANQIAVYNTNLSGTKTIGGIRYDFIEVAADRIGAIDFQELKDGSKIPFSSAARTVTDAVYDWSRFGAISQAFEWIDSHAMEKGWVRELVQSTANFGNVGAARRIGFVLQRADVSRQMLLPLTRMISATSSYIPLDPTKPKRGSVDKTWGVVINA